MTVGLASASASSTARTSKRPLFSSMALNCGVVRRQSWNVSLPETRSTGMRPPSPSAAVDLGASAGGVALAGMEDAMASRSDARIVMLAPMRAGGPELDPPPCRALSFRRAPFVRAVQEPSMSYLLVLVVSLIVLLVVTSRTFGVNQE